MLGTDATFVLWIDFADEELRRQRADCAHPGAERNSQMCR
jgi:hypothetical protein